MLPNRPAFDVCSHAAWKLGAVEVPVNVMYPEEEVEHILRDSGATVALVGPDRYDLVRSLQASLPEPREVVLSEVAADGGGVTIDQLARSAPPVEHAVDPVDELAIIAYTSGTTGYPKGAMLTHEQLSFSMDVVRDALGPGAGDNILQMLPCFHSNELLAGMAFAWQLGSTATLVDRFDALALSESSPSPGLRSSCASRRSCTTSFSCRTMRPSTSSPCVSSSTGLRRRRRTSDRRSRRDLGCASSKRTA